jgi:hypothetical protein
MHHLKGLYYWGTELDVFHDDSIPGVQDDGSFVVILVFYFCNQSVMPGVNEGHI